MGFDSQVWVLDQDYLAYAADRVILDPGKSLLRQFLSVARAGLYVFGRWDVVQYNYGSTLFSQGGKFLARRGLRSRGARLAGAFLGGVADLLMRMELGVLRLRRIPVFVLYQGDEARQGSFVRANYPINHISQVPYELFSAESDKVKARQLRLLAKHAAKMYSVNPDLLDEMPPAAEFVPYGHVDIAACEPTYPSESSGPLVFAHAPTNRPVKGTALFLAALDELRAEGYEFSFDLVEGVTNDEALARYERADVMLDQLFVGWYGGLAVEAMALGKPVVVYLRESDLRHVQADMVADLPFYRAEPSTIKDVLREILQTPRAELAARGRASRAFVERWHDPVAIAERIAADYREALAHRRHRRPSA